MMKFGSVMVFGEMVNAGAIVAGGEALVVDTMYPASALLMKKEIESDGSKVGLVFNTHHHSDHTFGNSVFQAPVMASRKDAATMRENLKTIWNAEGLARFASQNPGTPDGFTMRVPEIAFSGTVELSLDKILARGEVYGGHTPGSSVLIAQKDGVLFSGDLLFIGRHPYTGDGNMEQWAQALRRLLPIAREMQAVVPGHGRVLVGNDIEVEISRLIDYFEGTLDAVSNIIASGIQRDEAPAHPSLPVLATLTPTPEDRRVAYIKRVFDEVMARPQL